MKKGTERKQSLKWDDKNLAEDSTAGVMGTVEVQSILLLQ